MKCIDTAYAASDKEIFLKMMRKAEAILRGEFWAKQASDGSKEQALTS